MEGRGLKPYYLDTSLRLRLLTGDPPELAAHPRLPSARARVARPRRPGRRSWGPSRPKRNPFHATLRNLPPATLGLARKGDKREMLKEVQAKKPLGHSQNGFWPQVRIFKGGVNSGAWKSSRP